MKYFRKGGYILALVLFLIFTVGPFIWTFILSVTPDYSMFSPDSNLLPDKIIWDNYRELFSGGQRGARFLQVCLIL